MNIVENVSYIDVAQKLVEKKVVAIFQGRSEAGPRALGNRSMLYTPIDPDGKTFINKIKNRENFRPLAASILYEYANEWFDMNGIDESPFMSFSFLCRENKKHIIPSVIHKDGSCRIQTVKRTYNFHYYSLIESFYNLTNIPILLNTSFNIQGEPIVETINDAFNSFIRSKINILYLPELKLYLEK